MDIDACLVLPSISNNSEFYGGRKCILRRGWHHYHTLSFWIFKKWKSLNIFIPNSFHSSLSGRVLTVVELWMEKEDFLSIHTRAHIWYQPLFSFLEAFLNHDSATWCLSYYILCCVIFGKNLCGSYGSGTMSVSGSDDTKGKETWSLSWESSQQNNDTANVIIMPSMFFFEITSKKKKKKDSTVLRDLSSDWQHSITLSSWE